METAIGEVLWSQEGLDLRYCICQKLKQVATFLPEDSQKESVKYSMTSAKSFLIRWYGEGTHVK